MHAQVIIDASRVLVSAAAVGVAYDFTTRSTGSANNYTQAVTGSADKMSQAVVGSVDKIWQAVVGSTDKISQAVVGSADKISQAVTGLSVAVGMGLFFVGGGLVAIGYFSTKRSNSGEYHLWSFVCAV